MEDVRTRRGADMASDHHLVVAKIKLKLKNTGKLGKQLYRGLLKEEETTMEENRERIKEALTSTCHKHHHKECISIEIQDNIKERKNKKTVINNSRTRTEKVKAQAEYTEINKQMKHLRRQENIRG
ncbi:unnamed protein product [Schistosoma margrebowiei]|uniref:Uncharacterized protein n=1 Tax=Schistosoma margrebowiei TaxID=48269 RepID=A0A183LGN3_9TREM|nr:unnamed protein product [Schistosoma margrebowiei]